jgi:hypothetical protein
MVEDMFLVLIGGMAVCVFALVGGALAQYFDWE